MSARMNRRLIAALLLIAPSASAAPPAAKPSAAPAAEAPAPTPTTAERSVPEDKKPDEKKKASGQPVKTEEGKEGVKTYQFGAVEVEGRLRSPQLIYFLRRVRAEFVAGDLGHRSFLRELDSTRRNAAFR